LTNGSNKVGMIGLGIAIIAIIMSGVALAMLTGVSKNTTENNGGRSARKCPK